jgi:hypothetical protein
MSSSFGNFKLEKRTNLKTEFLFENQTWIGGVGDFSFSFVDFK